MSEIRHRGYIGGRTRRRRAPQRRPETVAEGVEWLRASAIQLFERDLGREADWPIIAQTLFATAFSAIDEAEASDPRTRSILRRVEGGVYDRLTRSEPTDRDGLE